MGLGNLLADTEIHVPALHNFLGVVRGSLNVAMIAVLAILILAGIIFAVWLAIRLGKAEDDGKRKEAKNQMIWAIIGVLAAVLITVLLLTVFDEMSYMGLSPEITYALNQQGDQLLVDEVVWVLNAIMEFIGIIFQLAALVAVGFGVYIAYRLATASDDSKRKQAKQQLLWTIVGVFGAIVLAAIINQVFTSLVVNQLVVY